MVKFVPVAAEIGLPVWGTPPNLNGIRVLAALLHGIYYTASAKLCSVEQRAPPMFGRATITLALAHISSFTVTRSHRDLLLPTE